jgi:hypothetical protein
VVGVGVALDKVMPVSWTSVLLINTVGRAD